MTIEHLHLFFMAIYTVMWSVSSPCQAAIGEVVMKRKVVIGEKLVKGNVWRNEFVREEYRKVSEHAMRDHKKKYPDTPVELVFSFDEAEIAGFEKAVEIGALGVAGYKYSTTAIEAAQLAQKHAMPFVTAVSPIKNVRNDFAISLAYSHDQLKSSFAVVSKKFDHPSIVLVESEHLTNLEYARIFEETFKVVKTFQGPAAVYLNDVKSFIKSQKDDKINVFMAGYGLSQFDIVNTLFTEFGDRLNFIAHTQWVFCERILSDGLDKKISNLYAITDYSSPSSFDGTGISVSSTVLQNNSSLKAYLNSTDVSEKMPLDEPVVYTMRDMLHIVLEAAENSTSRTEFLTKSRNTEFHGFSDQYMIIDGIVRKRVYLAKWNKTGFKPIELL